MILMRVHNQLNNLVIHKKIHKVKIFQYHLKKTKVILILAWRLWKISKQVLF